MSQLIFSVPNIYEPLPIYKAVLGDKKHYMKPNTTLGSVFGVFAGANHLSGGRFIPYSEEEVVSKQDIIDTVKFYNDNGVAVRLTYTSLLASAVHLDNEMFNFTLDIINQNDMNGVIVSLPLIEDYVKSTYSNCKIISSITNWNTSKDHARSELDRGVDMLVLNSALVRDYEFLKTLDLSRVEILINDRCSKRCAVRREHFEMESHMNLTYDPSQMNDPEFFQYYEDWSSDICVTKQPPPQYVLDVPNEVPMNFNSSTKYLNVIDTYDPNEVWVVQPDEFDHLVDIGVTNFKIAGRRMALPNTISKYMILDEYQYIIDDMYERLYIDMGANLKDESISE